jgi:hypothetical protein
MLLGLVSYSFAQESDEQIKAIITQDYLTYARAFEFKDYNKIAEYFHYPVLLSGKSILDKEMLIGSYKNNREKQIQPGYKYSIIDEIRFIKISIDLVIAEFYYSRYNSNYEKIFSGERLGTYKKIDGKWKISEYGNIK